MEKLNTIIVEDEFHGRETLKNLIDIYCPSLAVIGMAATITEGIGLLKVHSPDLVFLDIEFKNGSGFDLLKRVDDLDFEVIFTTAYKDYAIKAIKFSAIDYLLKPIDVDELQSAVIKVLEKKRALRYNKKLEVLLNNIGNKDSQGHSITLSTSEGYEFINVNDIHYCEASGSYTNFYIAQDKKLLVSKHLKEYEILLSDHGFMRVHQSFLINLSQVKRYVKSDGGYIVMKNGGIVNISSKKKEAFLKKML